MCILAETFQILCSALAAHGYCRTVSFSILTDVLRYLQADPKQGAI